MSIAEARSAGRTRVTSKALSSVASAVAGESLGVNAGSVRVELTDSAGSLVLSVSAPIRLPSLRRLIDERGVVERSGGTVLARAERAQEEIRRRVSALTGSDVARVVVRITGSEIRQEKRVR